MHVDFKRVPAVDKCFAILELLAEKKRPLGISDIAGALNLNKSSVFHIVHTLTDLAVLENSDGKFRFGVTFYVLGRAAENGSDLIRIIHPYLEEISKTTSLSAFLGVRSGLKAVILDKVDSPVDLKISTDIGIGVPLLAGAGGKVLTAQLSDAKLDEIIEECELRKFTPFSCTNKESFKEMIRKTRWEGIAVDREEYLEGIRALAVPVQVGRRDLQVAIWAVGLANQVKEEVIPSHGEFMKNTAKRIEGHFFQRNG